MDYLAAVDSVLTNTYIPWSVCMFKGHVTIEVGDLPEGVGEDEDSKKSKGPGLLFPFAMTTVATGTITSVYSLESENQTKPHGVKPTRELHFMPGMSILRFYVSDVSGIQKIQYVVTSNV